MIIWALIQKLIGKHQSWKINLCGILFFLLIDALILGAIAPFCIIIYLFPYHIQPQGWGLIGCIILYIIGDSMPRAPPIV